MWYCCFSQPTNNRIRYSIIGDDSAVTLFGITDTPTTENGQQVVDGLVRTTAVLTNEGIHQYIVSILDFLIQQLYYLSVKIFFL